jgi:lysozyme
MSNFVWAIDIIKRYEGFHEKAYADPDTGDKPYTIGYGTQFYPDGSPVKKGHYCTKEKAVEYLLEELRVIKAELNKLEIPLEDRVVNALLSFIHSIGWQAFLYSNIIENLEQRSMMNVIEEMNDWIYDADHRVIGSMLERRREETSLILGNIGRGTWGSGILLRAIRNYRGASHQVNAIKNLESYSNPYVLADFANEFCLDATGDYDLTEEELSAIFNCDS